MKNKYGIFIGVFVLVVGAFSLGAYLYKENQQEQFSFLAEKNNEVFVRAHSPRYGNENARVFLIEYLDPECESCRKFYPKVKKLLKDYEGKVQLIVRYAPFHRNSQIAIRALEAAKLQGKYWEAMELLFEKQPEWGNHHHPRPGLIFTYLPTLGLDMEKLKNDMMKPEMTDIIKQDYEDLKTLQVRGTPTFFVNGKRLEKFGIGPLEELVKSEVEKVY